jgi:hypothetical protein
VPEERITKAHPALTCIYGRDGTIGAIGKILLDGIADTIA